MTFCFGKWGVGKISLMDFSALKKSAEDTGPRYIVDQFQQTRYKQLCILHNNCSKCHPIAFRMQPHIGYIMLMYSIWDGLDRDTKTEVLVGSMRHKPVPKDKQPHVLTHTLAHVVRLASPTEHTCRHVHTAKITRVSRQTPVTVTALSQNTKACCLTPPLIHLTPLGAFQS